MYRTKTCGELNIKNVGEVVELAGWIQKIRKLRWNDFYRFKRWIWNYTNCNKWRKVTRTSKGI